MHSSRLSSGSDGPRTSSSSTERLFSCVEWLPEFRLTAAMITEEIEVANATNSLAPFVRLHWRGPRRVISTIPPARGLEQFGLHALKQMRREIPPEDLSGSARVQRYNIGSAVLALELTKAAQRFASPDEHLDAIEQERARYLRSIDAGKPLAARSVKAMMRRVPNCLVHLGSSLPTAEAVAALRPYGRVFEMGAGLGLLARALERAGVMVHAFDLDETGNTGIAFPVARGIDAMRIRYEGVPKLFGGQDPVILIAWPDLKTTWYEEPFSAAKPGQVLALASPEMEFILAGATDHLQPQASEEWSTGFSLAHRLERDFDLVTSVPIADRGPGDADVRLRLWRRR